MSEISRLDMIREMERSGCDIAYHASTESPECTITVYWRGWQTTVIRLGTFDFERAYTEWTEYRDRVAYRVMTHQDQPRAAVRAQERPSRSKRVESRMGVATPHVAAAVQKQTSVANSCSGSRAREGMSLKDRLKQRNQDRGAA